MLAVSALVLPQLGKLKDALHSVHSYCAEHDDFGHDDMVGDFELDAPSATLALSTPPKAGSKAHSHCDQLKAGLRPAETYERCPGERPPKASKRPLTEPQPRPVEELPIYALAPKQSPPAAALS